MDKISIKLNKNGSITMRAEKSSAILLEGSPAYLLVLNVAMSKFGCEWFGSHKWNHIHKPKSICHISHQGYYLLEAIWRLIQQASQQSPINSEVHAPHNPWG